jgi:putative transposase
MYCFYLEKLKQACNKHKYQIHAYVLMTNHVHMLITPYTENGISKVMLLFGRYYVPYFNYTYERTGTLWEGRFNATLIDSETYALTCYRYIELNPVRAQGMAKHPSEYPWSSYRHNALGQTDTLVIPHSLYNGLGATDEERQSAYRALFKSDVSQATLDEIRMATNKAWVLGSDYFKDLIEKQLNRQTKPKDKGGDRKSNKYYEKINRV